MKMEKKERIGKRKGWTGKKNEGKKRESLCAFSLEK